MNSPKNKNSKNPKAPPERWVYPDTPPRVLRGVQQPPALTRYPFGAQNLGADGSGEHRTFNHAAVDNPTRRRRQAGLSENARPLAVPPRSTASPPAGRQPPNYQKSSPTSPKQPKAQTPRPAGAARMKMSPATPKPKKRNKKKKVLLGLESGAPSSRRETRAQSQLDPERLEIERRDRERYMFYLKKRRKNFFRVLVRRLILFVVILVMMATGTAAAFAVAFFKTDRLPRPDIAYKIGNKNVVVSEYAKAHSQGVLLVNFFEIADLCEMVISGGASELKFSVQDENGNVAEYARFFPGRDLAVVNGQPVRLSAPARLIEEELWIPLDFLTGAMRGLSVTVSESGSRVDIGRIELNSSTPSNRKYETVAFLYKEKTVILPIDESQIIGLEAVKFVADLSAYEQYMNPAKRDDFLLLVNSENRLSQNYVPEDLAEIAGAAEKQLREYAAKALEALLLEAQANGIKNLRVSSAYRSYANQNYLFNYYINDTIAKKGVSYEAAYQEVITYSAPAGMSEHQTGLAIDITSQSSLDESFAQTEQYRWLSQNAHKFGFILRYPEDKTEITKIVFEPWHFRFVGRYHATRIYESGLCLEEYLDKLQNQNH